MKTARSLSAARPDTTKQSRFRRGNSRRVKAPVKLFNFLTGRTSSIEETTDTTPFSSDLDHRILPEKKLGETSFESGYGATNASSIFSGNASKLDEWEPPSFLKNTFVEELAFEKNAFETEYSTVNMISLLVPEKNPFFWLVIDGVLLLSTVGVLLVLYVGSQDTKLFKITLEEYPKYTIVNTFVWDFQILLTIWYNARFCAVSCEMMMKLAFAILYTYLIYALITSNDKDSLTIEATYWDMLMNVLAYVYVFFESYSHWRMADDLMCLEAHFAEDFNQDNNYIV